MQALQKLHIFFKPQHRSIVMGSVLIAMALLGFVVYFSYLSHEQTFHAAEKESANLVRTVEAEVSTVFELVDQILLRTQAHIYARPFQKHWTRKEYEKILAEEKKYVPLIFALKIINEKGEYSGDAQGVYPAAILTDRSYFQRQSQDTSLGMLISEPIISKSTGRWIVSLTRRLYYQYCRFSGIVVGTVLLENFQKLFQHLNIENGNISLMNDQNILVVRQPHIESMLGKKVVTKEFIDNVFQKKNEALRVIFKSPVDGVTRLNSFRKLRGQGAYIVIGLSYDDIFKDIRARTQLIYVIIFSIYLGFGYFLFHYLHSIESLDKQRQDLIASSKMSSLGEMASGIAHEINNPLSVIQSRADMILRSIRKGSLVVDEIQSAAEKIKTTSQRVAKIIQGLRSFSRNAENDPIAPVMAHLILSNVMDLCQTRFKTHAIKLLVTGDAQVVIPCREVQIEQVLVNLFNNAMDAVLELPEKWIEVRCRPSKNKFIFQVVDSGKGIPKHIREKMMNPFYSTKEVGKGTGLGLSISQGIIAAHGGRLFYDEEESHTCFTIELPLETDKTSVSSSHSNDGNFESGSNYDI
jgi:signal transduction histidine kinase